MKTFSERVLWLTNDWLNECGWRRNRKSVRMRIRRRVMEKREEGKTVFRSPHPGDPFADDIVFAYTVPQRH